MQAQPVARALRAVGGCPDGPPAVVTDDAGRGRQGTHLAIRGPRAVVSGNGSFFHASIFAW